jgi:hypothetical protein
MSDTFRSTLKSLLPEAVKAPLRALPGQIRLAILSGTYALRMPNLTAAFWILFSKKVADGKHPKSGSIIVFDSPGGLDDMRAAFTGEIFDFEVRCIDGELIKHLFAHIFGENYCDYQYKARTVSLPEELGRYRTYLSAVTRHLKEKLQLQAFVNFNFVYHAQRELMNVARNHEVKFITVMKECLRTQGYYESTVVAYQNQIGLVSPSAILVHNSQTHQLVTESGICPNCTLEIVGQGRSDRLFRFRDRANKNTTIDASRTKRKRVLYFAISETAGLPYFGFSSAFIAPDAEALGADFDWGVLAASTLDVLCEYVDGNEGVELVVKGKPTGVYEFKRKTNPRITYLHGNPDINLLESIDVVVGFNTTGLFEAIAAGVPTISSELNVQRGGLLDRYLYEFEGAAEIAADKADLYRLLDKALGGNYTAPQPQSRDKVLERYLGNSDGNAGSRLNAALVRHINS